MHAAAARCSTGSRPATSTSRSADGAVRPSRPVGDCAPRSESYAIDRVDTVDAERITAAEARRAGYDSATALRADLDRRTDGDVYRVQLHLAGPDTRVASASTRAARRRGTCASSTGAWHASIARAATARGRARCSS